MPTPFNSLLSFLKDVAPGIFGTYGTPAAPATGDTDWSGVDATGAALNELANMTDGQLIIGKSGASAVPNPTAAPVLTAGTSGSLAAGTYEVARTWPNAYGETQISPVASITFASGTTNSIGVGAVTPPAGITSVNTYMSDAPGSSILRYKSSNAGGAFTITSLPVGGSTVPPSSNTTASSNHAVKGALTGSNGIAITNGPGTVAAALAVTGDITVTAGAVTVAKVNGVAVTGTPSVGYVPTATSSSAATWQAAAGGTTIASGTSLPGSPASGDLFIRTDLKTINRFNGTTWDVIGFTNALTSAHINVGNGSNVATDVAMSGDATIANTGAVTVSKINGVSVSGTPSTGQVPTATGTTTATWQTPTGGGGGISSGTTFPGSPATNDMFFRTDRHLLYFWDGTRWLTVQLFDLNLMTRSTQPYGAGTLVWEAPIPGIGVNGVWVESVSAWHYYDNPQSVSNFHTYQLDYITTGSGTVTNLGSSSNSQSLTNGLYYVIATTIGAVAPTNTAAIQFYATPTGTPGSSYGSQVVSYRRIG